MKFRRADEENLIPLGVQPRGSMTDIYIDSYEKVEKNKYKFNLRIFSYWNQWGLRVYLRVKNSSGTIIQNHLLGTQIVYQSEYSKTNYYSKTITIDQNCSVYAYTMCSLCDDRTHTPDHYIYGHYSNGQVDPEDWSHTSPSISLTYENPTPAPTAPTSVKLTGRYEVGENPVCSWSGSTNAKSHDIQVRYWSKIGNIYTDWENVEYANSSSSKTLYNTKADYNCIQARVKANGNGTSGWKESNWLYRQGVRVWDGSKWVFGYIRVWDGSSWKGYEGVYNHTYNGTKYVVSK